LQVSVRFFTTLREIVDKKEEILEFQKGEKVTVNRVLKRLSEEYGRSFDEYVYDKRTGEARGFLQFLVNGRAILSPEGMEAKLANGDVLAIVPPIGGG
jgi:MoaD family protein